MSGFEKELPWVFTPRMAALQPPNDSSSDGLGGGAIPSTPPLPRSKTVVNYPPMTGQSESM